VRLLLDETISPRVARELRERGHDVQAVKKDRWVQTLSKLLAEHGDEGWLRNRVHHLP
jgi:hypothetical protein